MSAKIKNLLEQIGLLPSECEVYLSALRLSSETVQNIAREAGISRTATYDSIESLQAKGLITNSIVGKKRLYSAEDPARLLQIIRDKQEHLERNAKDLKENMDILQLLAGGIKPAIQVFEGKEALHSFYSLIHRLKPKELLQIVNVDIIYNTLGREGILSARKAYPWDIQKFRVLFTGSFRDPRNNVEYRQLKQKPLDFPGNIAIFCDYVIFSTWDRQIASFLVESPQFTTCMRALFEAAWETAEPVDNPVASSGEGGAESNEAELTPPYTPQT